ncbi:MAG: crotonase/enoyl-CoA hydratase family protein [Alphaproteobacteria bacterium]
MARETLKLEVADGIATVTLARPAAMNAMNRAFWQEMVDVFTEIDDTPEARVVVLAAEGKHFTAGLDLTEFGQITAEDTDEGRRRERLRRQVLEMQETFSVIERCRVPVLAAIHGACIGGGIDLISACDVRYATEDAFFSIHEINIGIVADVGTLQRLPHLMPAGLVRELAFTGRRMAAAEAAGCGLVTRSFANRDAMLGDVMKIAAEIATKSPLAISGTKEMLTYARDHSVADGLNYVATWNAAMLISDDLKEAISAQMEKRPGQFGDLAAPPRFVKRRA